MISLLTEPALSAPVLPAAVPAAATPPRVVLVLLRPLVPACVLLVVAVFWVALVLWFVVALGLMVTLLCGIARNVESVFTEVLALGATDWVAVVPVVLPARLVVLPVPEAVVDPVPAWVLLVVAVFWVADVVWLVVPLGLMVTVLCGIARKVVFVSTVVLALGATDWVDWVLVLLVAVLLVVLLVCARTEPLVAAKTTAAMRLSLFLIIRYSVTEWAIFGGAARAECQSRGPTVDGVLLRAGEPHQKPARGEIL